MMDCDLIQLTSTNYYMIHNKAAKQTLFLNHESKNIDKETVTLQDPNQKILGQVWMLVQVAPDRYPNMYEIVHTLSTLVLTSQKDSMSLKPGKWKSTQLYFLQRHNPKNYPNQFWIRESKESNRYLSYEKGVLKMSEMINPSKDNDGCIWQLILVHHNPIINGSCYIEYAYSNMVLDVPKASDKPGTVICQYPCNNRFNQRWNLIKCGDFHRIQNLKSGMCLDIKGQSKKPGAPIIQWKTTGSPNQLWKIEYQGKNIYLIRSAMDGNLLLSVKDNSLRQCADIVTTNDQNECFWRIVGYIPD